MWDRFVQLFDWSVKDVCEPEPFYHNQLPGQIAAYKVVVTYNYHGIYTQYFLVGKYGVVMFDKYAALRDATDYYNKMRSKIKNVKIR